MTTQNSHYALYVTGIDCEQSRNAEVNKLIDDAKSWVSNGYIDEVRDPKTGGTPLHVAAAKGYTEVRYVFVCLFLFYTKI